jgi:hypothetical protein
MSALEPDRDQIEIFTDAIFRHAGSEGYISLRSFLNDNKVLKPIRTVKLKTATHRFLVDVAEDQARRAANNPEPAVFCPPLAVFNGKSEWQTREGDLFKGIVLSVECDEQPDEARRALEEILGPATAVVRSGGQWIDPDGAAHDKLHLHWRLSAPAMNGDLPKLKRARQLAAAIVGGDPSNVPVVHCLRWPGSYHRKKAPRLCELVRVNPDVEIDLEAALAALEAVAPKTKKANGLDGGEQADPADWSELTGNIIAGRDLHLSITRLATKYVRSGMSAGAAVNQLRGLMEISQAKHQRPDEWQSRYDDIPRAVESGEDFLIEQKKKKQATATPCSLNDVVAAFDKWLVLEDKTPLFALLGTVIANLLPGDPVWLGIIAPPSSAKTELLNSISRLPFVAVAEAVSPAALLSGTPKRQRTKGATGGLLMQVGDFGILAFKDFGTVLEMRVEARAEMLAALRRVFDGEYVRTLGSDGGKTIAWSGKVGLIFAATQKYDLYHGVIGTLGDRFLLSRLDSSDDSQFDMCFKHVGTATKTMRGALAEAVTGLFASLPNPLVEPPRMTKEEMATLKQTVMLAIRLRAGVERDRIRREIEAVYDPEGPARLALSLERLFSGLIIIGLARDVAMKVIQKITMDSVPRFRLKAYRALTDTWQTTREVATTIELPTTTTHRALEDLVAQRLAVREATAENGANQWKRGDGAGEGLQDPNPQTTGHGESSPKGKLPPNPQTTGHRVKGGLSHSFNSETDCKEDFAGWGNFPLGKEHTAAVNEAGGLPHDADVIGLAPAPSDQAALITLKQFIGFGVDLTVDQIVAAAEQKPPLKTALLAVAPLGRDDAISNVLLARWLRKHDGVDCDGFRIEHAPGREHVWRLVELGH